MERDQRSSYFIDNDPKYGGKQRAEERSVYVPLASGAQPGTQPDPNPTRAQPSAQPTVPRTQPVADQKSAYFIDNDPRYGGQHERSVYMPPSAPIARAQPEPNPNPTRAQSATVSAQPTVPRAVPEHRPPSKDEVARLQAWAKKLLGLNCKKLSKKFEKEDRLALGSGLTTTVCKAGRNIFKWRNAEVFCIDQTRVVLKDRGSDRDFIHANWMGSGPVRYICTQAPFRETQEDFWHMCYKERASIVIMICDVKERSDPEKCAHYFPEREGATLTVGPYTITTKANPAAPVIGDAEFRAVEIKCKDGCLTLQHCVFRGWSERCAPDETERVLKLWRWARTSHAGRPVVVHSSCGSGRAATFCSIDYAISRIAVDKHASMLDVVKALRRQRHAAVHSDVQFLYLHWLVLDALVSLKIVKPYTASKFVADYKRHTQKHTERVTQKPVMENAWEAE